MDKLKACHSLADKSDDFQVQPADASKPLIHTKCLMGCSVRPSTSFASLPARVGRLADTVNRTPLACPVCFQLAKCRPRISWRTR